MPHFGHLSNTIKGAKTRSGGALSYVGSHMMLDWAEKWARPQKKCKSHLKLVTAKYTLCSTFLLLLFFARKSLYSVVLKTTKTKEVLAFSRHLTLDHTHHM